jgi:hypothetical protein
MEGAEVSSITGTLSSFFANKKESKRENKIKLSAITRVVLVNMSALEEPKAVWLAPPIIFIAFPPLPDWNSTNKIKKILVRTKKNRTVPVINPILKT